VKPKGARGSLGYKVLANFVVKADKKVELLFEDTSHKPMKGYMAPAGEHKAMFLFDK
jgi:hypothetical protein